MTVTLIEVIQRISRKIGLNPAVTDFSNNDETSDLVQDINEAYEDLVSRLPSGGPYLQATGQFNTNNGTRLYSLNSDAMLFDLLEASIRNTSENNARIVLTDTAFVHRLDSDFDTVTGKPSMMYREGNQVGLYPVPDNTYIITYRYTRLPDRLSASTDTFLLPDLWVRYIERRAQAEYEKRKGYGSYERTEQQAFEMLADIMADADRMDPGTFVSEGF